MDLSQVLKKENFVYSGKSKDIYRIPGQNLTGVVEAWTKGKSDTLIAFESLVSAGLMTEEEILYVQKFVKDIA